MMIFEWDPPKADTNLRIHGVSFESAKLVFDDPNVCYRQDYFLGELRDQAIGTVDGVVVLLVVHTVIDEDENHITIRIISARHAERAERKLYRDSIP